MICNKCMLINVLNIYAKYFVDVTDIYETVSVYYVSLNHK